METEQRRNKLPLIIILTTLFLLLSGVFAYFIHMAKYYKTHFLTGSIINGYNYSQYTVEQVENSLAQSAESFSITLYERGGKKEVISAADIGYHYVPNGTVQNIMDSQNPYSWFEPSYTRSDFNVQINVDYDEKMLKSCFEKLDCTNDSLMVSPENAHMEYTDKNRFEVIPEVSGTTIDKEKLYQKIKTAIDTKTTFLNLEKEDIYLEPKITKDSKKLTNFAKKLNRLTRAKITYDFGDRKETLDRSTLKDWLIINRKKKTAKLNENKVREYVAYLAEKYDTYGKPRKFTNHYGKTIMVDAGNYGWLINQETETDSLLSLIKKGKKTKRKPEYIYTGISRKSNDIGKTYIEVDLTNQHLWYYIKGKLFFETDLVSGDVMRGRETPTGTYTIMYCHRNAVLVGSDYRTPVSYWMPFFNGCGLHDAKWRWSFGGEIYQTNGSHGCLNLPLDAAQTIFENIDAGTPIVLYKGKKADAGKKEKNI